MTFASAALYGLVPVAIVAALLRRRANANRGNWPASLPKPTMTVLQYVEAFGLIPHPEGGYFRETYRSGSVPMSSKGKTDADASRNSLMAVDRVDGQRNVLTSIYYCLTTDSPRQWWANNMSDHIHYWHGGGALTYHVVNPDGSHERTVLGPRAHLGEVMQLAVRGGSFKCAVLEPGNGEFVLLGEAVAPGFDFRDFAFVSPAELKALVPDEGLYEQLKPNLKEQPETEFDDYYSISGIAAAKIFAKKLAASSSK